MMQAERSQKYACTDCLIFGCFKFATSNRNLMQETIRRLHRGIYLVPIILLCVNAVLSLYNLFAGKADKLALYFLGAGIITGWVSFATGIISLFLLKASKIARGLAFIHGFINSIALLVLTALWEHYSRVYAEVKPLEPAAVVFELLMIGLLIAGSFLAKTSLRKHMN